jgi:hypothetical protein
MQENGRVPSVVRAAICFFQKRKFIAVRILIASFESNDHSPISLNTKSPHLNTDTGKAGNGGYRAPNTGGDPSRPKYMTSTTLRTT